MHKYIKVWLILTINSFRSFLVSRVGAILFLTGKIIRFLFFFSFLIVLVSKTQILAGYTIWQVILFYFTFNFIDVTTQMLFREVYRFRELVLSGRLDLLLTKPVNVLFRALFGGTDLLDFLTLFPLIGFIGFAVTRIPNINFFGVIFYTLLLINALIIALSFHIFVLSLAVLTTEIDQAIMIYRDFIGMGKVPIDIYTEPLRSLVTFLIPVGVMITFPVKALIGLLSIKGLLIAFGISLIFIVLSLTSWRYSLRHYTSYVS